MGKIIAIVLALSLVLGFAFWKFSPNFSGNTQTGPVNLTIWGLWDNDSFIKTAIADYQKTHQNINISYKYQPSINYRTRVQTQILAGQGPDIFEIHNTWLPMFLQNPYLSPMPDSVMGFDEYNKTFYPVSIANFTKDKKIYALPFEIDGLALFYNEDILKAAGVNPPRYWSDFIDSAVKMTVKDTDGTIKTAGAAIGTTTNVDYWSDILGLLLVQQPGVVLEHPDSQLAADVVTFYTSFITNPARKTWDVTLENSTQAFVEGKLAYYFAPSTMVNSIKQQNPNLNFKVIPVPQLPDHSSVAWANYWGLTVSSNSQYPKEAWDFLKFLTSASEEKALYTQSLQGKLIGQPYSRVDLQNDLLGDPFGGAFVYQGPFYRSWYLSSNTNDAGLNDEMIANFQTAVNSVLQQNTDPLSALQAITPQVNTTMDKYTKPPVPAATH